MGFKKTRADKRSTYTFHFCSGMDITVMPGRDGITEADIRLLHSMDDAEVYNNIKNSRPKPEPWQKKTVEQWKAGHPGEEPEKNWNLSMDGLMKTGDQDTSIYAKQLAEMAAEKPDPQKELLYEKLSELSGDDQELYRLYFIEGYSQDEIGDRKGVSQNTISKKLRRIQKELTEMCRKEI